MRHKGSFYGLGLYESGVENDFYTTADFSRKGQDSRNETVEKAHRIPIGPFSNQADIINDFQII